jgi:hypothetical protein
MNFHARRNMFFGGSLFRQHGFFAMCPRDYYSLFHRRSNMGVPVDNIGMKTDSAEIPSEASARNGYDETEQWTWEITAAERRA